MSADPSSVPPEETDGRWTLEAGAARRRTDETPAWHEHTSALTYSNPFGQEVERVWFDGKVVYAVELGHVEVDPEHTPVAQEYQVVYGVELDDRGLPAAEPERVPGQYNIYDSVPGMEGYSPLWRFNYVIVPRDYVPNTLRSERECLESGYPILESRLVEN